MTFFIRLILVCQCLWICAPAAATVLPDGPMVLDVSTIYDRLREPSKLNDLNYHLKQLTFQSREPGLSVVGATTPEQLSAARKFADFLHARFGLELVLAASIEGAPTPVYSGWILDADRQIVGNFKLVTRQRHHRSSTKEASFAAHKFRRYADLKNLAYLVLERAHQVARFPGGGTTGPVEIDNPLGRGRYAKYFAEIQRAAALFWPLRPSWVFLEFEHDEPYPDNYMSTLQYLTTEFPELTGILIAQPGRWTTVREGDFATEVITPNCTVDLSGG